MSPEERLEKHLDSMFDGSVEQKFRARTAISEMFRTQKIALTESLRDKFAAQALNGYMARKSAPNLFHPDQDAHYVYAIADAMLRVRNAT